ncbi:MAG: 2-oxo acid dehydrogenase subunit E2 [Blastococcus sp.]
MSEGGRNEGGSASRRPREVEAHPFPASRHLVTAAVRAGRRIVPMHGLLAVDVTDARRMLAEHDPPLSMTAFVVASVARAAAEHPAVHAYRDWRGRLVQHRHVDVQTLIEVTLGDGSPFGLVHVVRDADVRGVPEITAELRAAKGDVAATASGRALRRFGPLAGRIPGVVPAMYAVMARSVRVRRQIGTVQVTAVGMFAGGGGFAIAPPTLASLMVVVGGLARTPLAVGDEVVIRDVLDLTVTIDHNVVDGAPATRFGAALRRRMQDRTAVAALLTAPHARPGDDDEFDTPVSRRTRETAFPATPDL